MPSLFDRVTFRVPAWRTGFSTIAILLGVLFAPIATSGDDTTIAGETDADGAIAVLNSTFKIFNSQSTATGFLVQFPPGTARTSERECLLITAQHVLEQVNGETVILVLREPQADGSWQRHDVTIPIRKEKQDLWIRHPSEDVAALRMTLPSDTKTPLLPFESLATDQRVRDEKLRIGHRLLTLGFPARVEANGAGFPICRHGCVASHPLVPTSIHTTMKLDMAAFGGDSGGPVFLAPEDRSPRKVIVSDGRQEIVSPTDPLILGLVVGNVREDVHSNSVYEERTVHHPLDLAIVVQAQILRDTVDLLLKESK